MLVVKSKPGLRFYIHSDIERQVADQDRTYLQNLLPDLLVRARDCADDVFRQLSQLSVGPLEADEVKPVPTTDSEITARFPRLQPIPEC